MMTEAKDKSVLFVCMGNICRSPAAEGVFRTLVANAGREVEFRIDSAGTHGYHVGHPQDSPMLAAARARGDDNYADICALDTGGGARVVRMVDYCERLTPSEVPDPYYGGPAGFEEVLDILEDACASLLRRL